MIVTAKYVNLAARFVAKEPQLEAIAGVSVEPAAPLPGAYVVALDGHKAGIFYDAQAEVDAPVVLRICPELVKACKTAKAEKMPRLLVVENGQARVTLRRPRRAVAR